MTSLKPFKLTQEVNCKVKVWRHVYAESMEHALSVAGATEDAPTSIAGCDYEIINDGEITKTTVEAEHDAFS